MRNNNAERVVTTSPASAAEESYSIQIPFADVRAGKRFVARDSQWEKRADNLGADLVDRDGCISFIGGRRCIEDFPRDEKVEVALDEACDAANEKLRSEMQEADDEFAEARPRRVTRNSAFTIVELLVVVVIIVTVAISIAKIVAWLRS